MRGKIALQPQILAANLLDHRFRGAEFDDVKLMHRLCQKLLVREAPLSEYLFSEDYKSIKPAVLWKIGKRLGFHERLCEIAESLVEAVPSSAGLERHFSTLGFTYGTLRCQLGVEKAGKLAFLYKQLNG